MFGGKKQSVNSNTIFQASVVKDRKVVQKGTLEATPSSITFRGDGSKTKLSWSLRSLRKIEASTDRLFMVDTGDIGCGLSEDGIIWFQMTSAKQAQNAILHNMNVMIKSETPQNHRGVASSISLPVLQQTTPISVFDEATHPPPPVHWRLNTRTSMESTSSNISPTNSRASLVQRDIFEVDKILENGRKERGSLEVLENEVAYVESESGECRRVVWTFKYIRRFGYEGDIFTLDVGRRAPGGAGLHNFKTSQPSELNTAVKASSMSGGGTPPSPRGRSSYTPPSQRHPVFSPPTSSSHPPPHHAAPLPPPPSQPPLPVPPSPPQTPRNARSSRLSSPKLGMEPKPKLTTTGSYSRSDSLLRRAFSAADLRQNVFDVRNISDDKQEVGQGTLEVTATDLIYIDARTNEKWRWPFKFLRKYGFEKNIFSFEAGRRCPGGQGLYAFSSDRASEIHETIVENIRGRKRDEEAQSGGSRTSGNNAADVPTKSMPKSQSRYSFTEEQSSPSSLVKLTNKNHYNIDMGLHALMQARPLPAEPSEAVSYPSLPSTADPAVVCPSKSTSSASSSSASSSSSEKDSKLTPTPSSVSTISKSPPPVPSTSPAPANYAQVVPPMQLVKPVMDAVVRPQSFTREHHYDTPANYGANMKSANNLKREGSSDQKTRKAESTTRANDTAPKKKSSKSSVKPQRSFEKGADSLSPRGIIATKDSKSQSKFKSFLKKQKKTKGASVDNCDSSAAGNDVNGSDKPNQLYVNVNVGSLRRMNKSASCDDILSSWELVDAHIETPSAVPLPQLSSSQTPPVQRWQGSNGYQYQLDQHRNSEVVISSSVPLVYQNLHDIRARGERSHSHPVQPPPDADSSTPAPSLTYQPHLYTNVEIMTETESPPPPNNKETKYAEIEIQLVAPPGVMENNQPRRSSHGNGVLCKSMHPLIKQALLPKTSPKTSPKRKRTQSLFPSPPHPPDTEINGRRDRPQSEVATEEEFNQAAVMVTTGADAVQDSTADQKFEPVQYAPLDFMAMRAVAAIKRDHNDVRQFEEILERHDIREMEMDGKRK